MSSSAAVYGQPTYPSWIANRVRLQREFIDNLRPFPFDQPADIRGFYSLHQNDYLRLSNHPEVVHARAEANLRPRIESFSSSVFGGVSSEHDRFVELLKESLQANDVILTTAGWTANAGLLEAICGEETPVYIDVEAHASMVDGIRFSQAKKVIVRHNDCDHLEKRIKIHGPGVICIDALYSTDGSLPDLPRYIDICERHDCILVLDEAHSFGMFGAKGGGLAVKLGLAHRVHFRTVSLSKALGGHGGLVAGSADMLRSLRSHMRPVLFSSSTSAILAAGHAAALEVLMREPERAAHCLEMAARFVRALEGAGVDTRASRSQIVSLFFKDEQACQLYGELRERRILSSVFVYPAIPRGISMLRFSVYSELKPDDIDYIADCTLAGLRKMRPAELRP
ncbi:aminotransferase class I/II-fold pyridoxal phosphate-dependent enzyme [Myxococcaceae bacterium JPH2]|nr:aminotransferase class I/II-fold pyridoxal phosphate-dependent enzyme [Myxococcaceae bacterium JPH2]